MGAYFTKLISLKAYSSDFIIYLGRNKNYIIKQSDIIFDDMRWRLTQQDGQLGIADVQFKKFQWELFWSIFVCTPISYSWMVDFYPELKVS